MEDGDPSVAQLLHERTFAFSFWPKAGGDLLLFGDQNSKWVQRKSFYLDFSNNFQA